MKEVGESKSLPRGQINVHVLSKQEHESSHRYVAFFRILLPSECLDEKIDKVHLPMCSHKRDGEQPKEYEFHLIDLTRLRLGMEKLQHKSMQDVNLLSQKSRSNL